MAEDTQLTPEELAKIKAENEEIIRTIKDPKKQAADKKIRDKAAAEGRALTPQELLQISYPTGSELTQKGLQEVGAGPQGTVYNPTATGEAAEKKPDNRAALNFGIYQEYLRSWNYGNRDYGTKKLGDPNKQPMPFEEFIDVFESTGANQNTVGQLASFSKGQGGVAKATGGRPVPGMDLLLDPRYGATVDTVLAQAGYDQGEDQDFLEEGPYTTQADGPYTTMGGPTTGLSTGSSANIRNPYKPGTQQYEDFKERRSAYDLLFEKFSEYGLGSLVEPLKGLITENVSPSEFTIRLRETEPYKKRFSANAQRVAKGLRALSESEYIRQEDLYQEVMRRRGLPPEYYSKGDLGVQKGFESLLAGDVSSTELEDRIVTAQDRVLNANPEVAATLKQFYPGISNGDILAYALDPANAINAIKRKITAAEIGGAAVQSGLQTGLARAEELARYGVTKDTAEQGFGTIAGGLQRGSQLASIYGEDPYSQATAETEVFKLSGAQEARKQRQKITGLEKATFGGQTGITSGALARDRAGGY